MSGIYIPGVENLKCNDCFWAIGYRLKCSCSSEQANYDMGERPKDCPLIPVPPHGRLCDMDALENRKKDVCEYRTNGTAVWGYSQNLIDAMQTIIPADEEDKE